MEVVDERKKSLWQRICDSSAIKRVRTIKNFQIIVVIFIIAIVLIIYSTVITSSEEKGQATTQGSVMNSEEERLCGVLSSIEGVGQAKTMITKNGNDVVGVVVIAEGASNPLVRIKIVEAVSVALGVDANLVSVFTGQN